MNGWLTMDSVPHDCRVLLCRRQKMDRVEFKSVVIGRHTGDYGNPKCWMFESVYAKSSDFLGWMPLPAPVIQP
jgi:hypothetical protein